ncbi:MAG: Fic family protein [Saprospiraceae bacterium]
MDLQQLKQQYQQYILKINKDNEHGNNFIDLDLVYPKTNDIQILCEQLTDLKKCLDSFRPLNLAQLKNLKEFYEVHYTYESNRIEGNTLTLQETYLVLNKGMTIGGKPLQDHVEAVNHRNAFQYIQEIAQSETDFSASVLLDIHDFILKNIDNHNAGKYRNVRVRISQSQHIPPNPLKVSDLMNRYFEQYETQKNTVHPVILAANMHERLVTIHPFIDGNGRTARLVMNLILLKNGYPITNISGENESRTTYYKALENVQMQKNLTAFQTYLLQECKTSLWNYIQLFADNLEAKKGRYFFEKVSSIF